MKERPILYSSPMVLALLARRKTQTRRRLGYPASVGEAWAGFGNPEDPCYWKCPYGRAGDRLWGRETWAWLGEHRFHDHHSIMWRATQGDSKPGDGKWRPSIFMPRWASRLLHEVTAVRVERLQDITAEDALAEGIEEVAGLGVPEYRWPGRAQTFLDPRICYLAGWDSINGKGSAAKSPWVWVVSFKPIEVTRG